MRGFSYVELLVGFAISTMLLLGFVRFGHQTTNQFLAGRRLQQAQAPLLTAETSLRRFFAKGEAKFWDSFSNTNTVIHEVDIVQGHVMATYICPHASVGGCLIMRDITPLTSLPISYRIVAQNYPNWIHPTPMEESLPQGPGDEFQPGLMALIATKDHIIPVIISEAFGDQVELVPRDQHLWQLPEAWPPGEPLTLIPIGYLSLTHISLHPSDERHFALRYQPWLIQESAWQAKRSRTGETQLVDLHIQAGYDDHPNRIFLIAQPLRPSLLPQPKTIGNKTYVEEAYHASIAF